MSTNILENRISNKQTATKSNKFNAAVFEVLKIVGSLKLTVTLFLLSVVLIFFGTLAQKSNGIWTVVDQYFWSWYVIIDLQLFVEFAQVFMWYDPQAKVSGGIPFPAGKTLGGLMFANLIAAHIVQFVNLLRATLKQTKKTSPVQATLSLLLKRSGLYVIHGGLLLLFVGEYITREFQVEQNMYIQEGEVSSYAYDTRNHELAFISLNQQGGLQQTVVPSNMLIQSAKTGQIICNDELPVDIEVLAWYKNSVLLEPSIANQDVVNYADAGVGLKVLAKQVNEVAGTDTDQRIDTPSAYIKLWNKSNRQPIGTYLVATNLNERIQSIQVNDTTFEFDLRFKRNYKDFLVRCDKVTYELYPGTNTPKNFASNVTILDLDQKPIREVKISMNTPLYFAGETFFQHQMSEPMSDVQFTVFQVVDNPGKFLPYISCVLVTLGLMLHFVISLNTFFSNQRKIKANLTKAHNTPTPKNSNLLNRLIGRPQSLDDNGQNVRSNIPLITLLATVFAVIYFAIPPANRSIYNLEKFGKLPVLSDGRLKPLDTSARVDLRQITSSESYKDTSGATQPAIRWYLDTAVADPRSATSDAVKLKIFRIENDRLWELLGIEKREGKRYSLEEIGPKLEELGKVAKKARETNKKDRSAFDIKVLELERQLGIFFAIMSGSDSLKVASRSGKSDAPIEWSKLSDASNRAIEYKTQLAREAIERNNLQGINPDNLTQEQIQILRDLSQEIDSKLKDYDPALKLWTELLEHYRAKKDKEFNKCLDELYELQTASLTTQERLRIQFEYYLNQVGFYYICMILYCLAAVIGFASLCLITVTPAFAESLRRSAFLMILVTVVLHTITLLARMYLMERPLVFVTNLYSSAVFIGWAAVLGGLLIERIFGYNFGNIVGSTVGFGTCIIAHNLAASDGDTLQMMQAVLDTNFWLATHVTTVSLGYSATYLAGFVGIIYLLLSMFTKLLNKPLPGSTRPDMGRKLGQMMYGIVCFGLLFSFVGTVLGGIWGDFSWGRFWGWDPKENGAVLIVIWNALILHARWSGLVKDRGIAVLAVLGNMITTWSWFGTNLLGVGLHSYGFSEDLHYTCLSVWLTHLPLAIAGMMPRKLWLSYDPNHPQT